MRLLSIEYSPAAYRLDFILYGAAVVGLAAFLLVAGSPARLLELAAFTAAGLAAWTAIEYFMHRFLMHAVDPACRWHGQHHARPTALLGTPTLVSAVLALLLVFLPALAWGDALQASALTLGVIAGYLAYGMTHHAIHHWPAGNRWLDARKRWHALHHELGRPVCFGVTSSFWDYVFRSTAPAHATDRGTQHGNPQ